MRHVRSLSLQNSLIWRYIFQSGLYSTMILLYHGKSLIKHFKYRVVLSVPLSALFILFDFVIHNPNHMQTKSNLSLLGIAAGYFCRLEYTSGGVYPTSILSDVAHFARDFVRGVDGKCEAISTSSMPAVGSSSQPRSVSSELHSLLPASVSSRDILFLYFHLIK